MELSDEEIKAIEKVKEVIKIDKEQRIVTIYDEKPLFRDQLQILIDLINKQQKEINSLQQELEIQKGCSISKDKIREKIKDYDKWIEETHESAYLESLQAQKYALEELLEDGDHIPRID